MTTPTPLFRFFTTALAVALLAALGVVPTTQAQPYDELEVLDDLEGAGADSSAWSTYNPNDDGDVTVTKVTDAPSENGGEYSISVTDRGGDGGGTQVLAGEDTPADTVYIDDASEAFFNFYIKPDPDTDFTAKILIEKRNPSEAFQKYTFEVPSGTEWRSVSIPLSEFNYGESFSDGDGEFDRIDKAYFETRDHSGEITYNLDYLAFTEGGPLPVELTSFTALADGDDAAAVLRWKTASETGNDGFRVMHAAPGASSFQQVDFVDGHGTTTSPQDYRFRIGDLASGTHRFRLQQVDRDGSVTPSPVVEATIRADQRALLTPTGANPFQSQTTLRYSSSRGGAASVSLYDVRGRKVRTLHEGTLSAGSSRTVTVAADGLSSGTYFVRFRAPGGATATQSITLVK
jgi:hypothetical protein